MTMHALTQRSAPGTLISFRGLCGAGKTTAAKYLKERYGFERVGFGDAVKVEAYATLLRWQRADRAHVELLYGSVPEFLDLNLSGTGISTAASIAFVDRYKKALGPLLQWLGEGHGKITPERRIAAVQAAVLQAWGQGKGVVIDDCRTHDELEFVKSLHGLDVYIEANPGVAGKRVEARDGGPDQRDSAHLSEQLAKDMSAADLRMDNRGARPALEAQLEAFMGLWDPELYLARTTPSPHLATA